MSAEDNDNIYVLEGENDKEQENSPLNFAAYDDDEREEQPSAERSENLKEKSAFGYLLKIMFNPVEGWKLLRRSKTETELLQSKCFYPLLALLALSNFADFFYSVDVNISIVITRAVITFVSFFFGYFCIQILLSWFLPKDMVEKLDSKFGKDYLIIALSTLALFAIFTELFPMIWPILIFLPIWTLYIMFKGVRFFKFHPQQEMKFFVLSGAASIGVPYFIDWALNAILPY